MPVEHLDQHHWGAGWEKPKLEDFRARVEKLIEPKEWVIEGAYYKVVDILAPQADIIVLIKQPRLKCIWRALKRQFSYNGQDLPYMAKDCPASSNGLKATLHFIHWIYNFDKSNTPKFINVLKNTESEKKLVVLKSNSEIANFLETL